MNPKEKAQELVNKFILFLGTDFEGNEFFTELSEAKECAWIATNEILKEISKICVDHLLQDQIIYWKQVKEEIQKLE